LPGDAATTVYNIMANEMQFRSWLLLKGVKVPSEDADKKSKEEKVSS
jgi:hypothetical protein